MKVCVKVVGVVGVVALWRGARLGVCGYREERSSFEDEGWKQRLSC